jgi:hypothetical protein
MEDSAALKGLGTDLMDSWNARVAAAGLFKPEMAVMGALREGSYAFIIERDGRIFQVQVREVLAGDRSRA